MPGLVVEGKCDVYVGGALCKLLELVDNKEYESCGCCINLLLLKLSISLRSCSGFGTLRELKRILVVKQMADLSNNLGIKTAV